MHKPILCLDFDGVIHSYNSGWKGPRTIPDKPVPGALQFIVEALDRFEVHIFSSRSRYWFGRRAMKQWLHHHLSIQGLPDYESTPDWLQNWILKTAFADPWDYEVDYAVSRIIKAIKWPNHKPPAMVTIDDRAQCFTGEWPSLEEIAAFQPWNKKPAADLERQQETT